MDKFRKVVQQILDIIRENGDFAIMKSGFRNFTIPQMGFAHLPL
jgi:hypothetical protein